MMTPQEVASSTFPKATLGGYNMAAVDVFLDKLTEDYTTIYKENAALKAKIKVLVDKMEEYHAMEDTMRSTLLTAQKMANSMISEAEEKRAALLVNAEADARARMGELAAEISAEEKRLVAVRAEIDEKVAVEQERLAVAQRELAAFISGAKKLCVKQMELIERLGEMEILPAGVKLQDEAAQLHVDQEVQPADIPEVKLPEPVQMDESVSDAPVDEATAAAAMAEVVEELGGDASTLMENMRHVIDSFANEDAAAEKPVEDPFEIGFDDADKLFDDDPEETEGDASAPADDTHYDDFGNEEQSATRVLNLKDLQFGRNYNKD